MRLEELKRGSRYEGIAHGKTVEVIEVQWQGTEAVSVYYKDERGRPDTTTMGCGRLSIMARIPRTYLKIGRSLGANATTDTARRARRAHAYMACAVSPNAAVPAVPPYPFGTGPVARVAALRGRRKAHSGIPVLPRAWPYAQLPSAKAQPILR